MTSKIISADWGSTHVRFRWVDVDTGEMGEESLGEEGVLTLQKKSGQRGSLDSLFQEVIYQHLAAEIQAQAGFPFPLVISGMPSARGAWCELPYASLPFALDGAGAVMRALPELRWPDQERGMPVLLVSGLAAADDVMRGEETQVIGLHEMGLIHEGDTVVLPGTHSKHVRIGQDEVTGFRSFMTGELFHLLGSQSSLATALNETPRAGDAAFVHGVEAAKSGDWAASLFPLRARKVLDRADAAGAASFLSGLLIGSELRNLALDSTGVMAGSESLLSCYRSAAEVLGLNRYRFVPEGELSRALVRGQIRLWRRHGKNL
ncbi:MAG: 2-dehydro-3-deoxygalactonokinase [Blastochloris sp.]|nr:2-dehydro-3-deoxygalactonokinase [Blastochloris sp.]